MKLSLRPLYPSTKSSRVFMRIFVSIIFIMIVASCASYYQKHIDFNTEFESGDLRRALDKLQSNSREEQGKARFLYLVNNGLLQSILGNYEASNNAFESAFLFGEDHRINYIHEATAYLTNPNFTVYRGEDHEHFMLLYFKAINYLKMNKPEEAIVECKRLNIRLNQLNDKYSSEEKFQRDAFIHTLMGITYQSNKDFNNAFIAYRNALEVYETDYARMFGMATPEQLKIDLLNTAYWIGFKDEFEQFKEKFSMRDYIPSTPTADLVFFWHNGLAPVKNEWSVNFVIKHVDEHTVVFNNDDLGISFPFKVDSDKDNNDLTSLEFFRVAFPRYVERTPLFTGASLNLNGQTYTMQLGEDISKVAFYSLKQRMLQEFGKGLLRGALKKATEHSVRKEDETLGALIGIVNAMTEKADTRNWQTLPHSIYYSRVPLNEGANDVVFKLSRDNSTTTDYNFTYQAKKGQTLFHTFSSLETMHAASRYY